MAIVHAVGGYQVSDDVLRAVQEASSATGVDFRFMMAKAAQESSFDATARARTSSATGLYQFIDSTWLTMVKEHGAEHGLGKYAEHIRSNGRGGYEVTDNAIRREILDLRNDPRTNAMMAAEFAGRNKAHLERTFGGTVGPTELYLAHFLGPGGATTFLNAHRRAPDMAAADLFPAAARANRSVFYSANGSPRSVDDLYRWMDRKVERGLQLTEGLPSAPPTRGGPAAFFNNSAPSGDAFMAGHLRNANAIMARGEAAAAPPTEAGQLSLWTVLTLASLPTPGEGRETAQVAALSGGEAGGTANGRIPMPTGFLRG